jgi:O-antigen ligase
VAVLGLLVLVAAAPTRAQLGAATLALATAIAAALATAFLPGVASLSGSHRERDGAIALAILVLLAAAAALAGRRTAPDEPLRFSRRLVPATGLLVALVAVGLVVAGVSEKPSAEELSRGAQATRLTTVSSNRYEYWRVGLNAFADHPLRGLGAAGFRVEWLKQRHIAEGVRDVHSLEFEMAAELGLVGLLAFAIMVAGVVLAARSALAHHRGLAAGPSAALVAWLLHASIDWDWQLPAVSLPAIALAGALIVLGESAPAQRRRADTGSSRRLAARARAAVAGS